jgi:phospholipid/cholesterol/gamma-HCH transport system permease protein
MIDLCVPTATCDLAHRLGYINPVYDATWINGWTPNSLSNASVNPPVSSSPGTTQAAEPLALSGEWTLAHADELVAFVARARNSTDRRDQPFDGSGITRLDTVGASLVLELIGGPSELARLHNLDGPHRALLSAVAKVSQSPAAPPTPARDAPARWTEPLAGLGESVQGFIDDALHLLSFAGLVLVTLARTLQHPRRWRLTALTAQIDQTGLHAVPIVSLLTFLVGCVVAFLGATILSDFGASIFTVQLIAFSFMREFGVLLTAILVAGRSGSAFTAQLGSMKAREEVDALRALGMDPIEVLVLPRLLALLVAMPLLSFIGMLTGIIGGGVVCALSLDISPTLFIARIYDTAEIRHFWVGMSKAPLFAIVIALIGCLEGFKVKGSAESVGSHTTSSVVQSIFVVILIDALAAIFFMEIDW